MPTACGAPVKYMWIDHNPAYLDEEPPIQNQWYDVMHDTDVRLLWCVVYQLNEEAAAKTIEIRWIIDGTTYSVAANFDEAAYYYIYKTYENSVGVNFGLWATKTMINAGGYVDKRGHDFLIRARMISAPGTDQTLEVYACWETLEQVPP